MDLSDEKLKQLLELEAKATPRPWRKSTTYCWSIVAHDNDDNSMPTYKGDRRICQIDGPGAMKEDIDAGENFEFILESRNHFRPLVEEVLRLREVFVRIRNKAWDGSSPNYDKEAKLRILGEIFGLAGETGGE